MILCAVVGVFQLVLLLMLTGFLVSVAAVSRLMEITIVLVYPTTVFLLRQSGKLVVSSISLSVGLTLRVYQGLVLGDGRVSVDMTTPEVQYARSVFPGLVNEAVPIIDMPGESSEIDVISSKSEEPTEAPSTQEPSTTQEASSTQETASAVSKEETED